MDWRTLYDALRAIRAGEDVETDMDSPRFQLLLLGLIENIEVTKPCRECGKPRHDYRWDRITDAGRVFMEVAAIASSPTPNNAEVR